MQHVVLKWGNEINVEETLERILEMRLQEWELRIWEPTLTLLNRKNGTREFQLKHLPVSRDFEVVGSSDHSHCEICWKSISAFDEPMYAYLPKDINSEFGWTCKDCFEKLVLAEKPEEVIRNNRRKYKS